MDDGDAGIDGVRDIDACDGDEDGDGVGNAVYPFEALLVDDGGKHVTPHTGSVDRMNVPW